MYERQQFELEEERRRLHQLHQYRREDRNDGRPNSHQSSGHHTGVHVKYPMETSIQTINGKKVVIYHDTGEAISYEDYLAQQDYDNRQNGTKVLTSGDKSLSKSTPNLADEEMYKPDDARQIEKDHQQNVWKPKHQNTQSSDTFRSMRERSMSVGDIRDDDKIDRYPSLLIVPGRKQLRKINPLEETYDKWRKKAPQYWGTLEREQDSNNSDVQQTNDIDPPYPTSNQSRKDDTIRMPPPTTTKMPSVLPRSNIPPSYQNRTRRLSGESTMSTFSDISVSSQMNRDVDGNFNQLYKNVLGKTLSDAKKESRHYREGSVQESDTSLQYEPCASPEHFGSDTLDRGFVFKAYPVKLGQLQ